MAQALGADLAHIDAAKIAIFVDPQLLVRGILVNGRGQRHVPEDTYPGRIAQLTLYQQDNTAFLVLDADAHEQAMGAPSATPGLLRPPTWVCETVAELETEMGLPPGSLQATVAAYNDGAARGEDGNPYTARQLATAKPLSVSYLIAPSSTPTGTRYTSCRVGAKVTKKYDTATTPHRRAERHDS